MDPNRVNPDEIVEFIKSSLNHAGSHIDLNGLTYDTDLVDFGIESIVLLQLISSIESHFQSKLSLDKLESHNFIISANSISECLY